LQNRNYLMNGESAKQTNRSWKRFLTYFHFHQTFGGVIPSLLIGVIITMGWPCLASGATIIYQPDTKTRPNMTVLEARRSIQELLGRAHIFYGEINRQSIHVTMSGFDFIQVWAPNAKSQPEVRSFQFEKLGNVVVFQDSAWGKEPFIVAIGDTTGKRGGWFNSGAFWNEHIYWETSTEASKFVDAVTAIRYYNSNKSLADDAIAFADFQGKALNWRTMPQKPPLPENAQRFRVLAEDAFRSKNFEESANYYEKGLEVSPLWPEGRFNAALLYGELQMYSQAIFHMKRYLELRPDAKNANDARERIYVWEEKAKK
jgi:tetratricopeptide (TPR) repeat protein